MKAFHQEKKRKKTLIKLAVIGIAVAGLFVFLTFRKDAFVSSSLRFFEACFKEGTDLTFRIEKISGNALGSIRFRNIRIDAPWLPKDNQTVFKAEEIQFHYRLLDFISKKQMGRFQLHVQHPEIYLRPPTGIRKPRFAFMNWLRDWATAQASRLTIKIDHLTIHYGANEQISDINLSYENNAFKAEIPILHLDFQGMDVSTILHFEGSFDLGADRLPDQLAGSIYTENTILNWKPLPSETSFNYVFTRESLTLHSSNFLGGIAVDGQIDFTKDYALDLTIRADNYPLLILDTFFSISGNMNESSRLDLEANFMGSPWAPKVEARARISDGWVKKKAFQAMEVNVEGVYPTVKLAESRVFLKDGQTMRFADTTLEFQDLFRGKTYEKLISDAQQETFVLGDWQFSRPKDKNDQPEFLMQKSFGEQAKVHLRKFNEDDRINLDRDPDDTKPKDFELGFEYRLRGIDSFKVQVKNDEELIGVERKVRF